MSLITGGATIAPADLYTSSAVKEHEVGEVVNGANGKAFKYCLAGAANLVVGNLLQSSAIDAQFDDMAVPATAAGLREVSITNGTTEVTANMFDGGTLSISVTPGLGEEYTIVSHGTAANGASLSIVLDRPLRTAWTTSTKVTLRRNPCAGVIQAPTTLTGSIVGVAIYPITASQYGWIQVRGVAGVLSDNSTGAIGSSVSNSAATAGSIGVVVAATARTLSVGRCMRALATGKVVPVDLVIA